VATIVILGAGELGGALARQLAAADVVATVVLVDDSGKIAEGKALDIRQAAPIDQYTTDVKGTTELSAVIGAAFLIVADRASTGSEWQSEEGLTFLKRVAEFNGTAPIVCAGAAQMSIVERGVREQGFSRTRLLGSAPEALRSAIVSMTALEAGCDPCDVSLTVVGRPPQQLVVPWEDASIAGRRATAVLSPPAITRLESRLTRLWPPGPMTLASAATRLVRAALQRSTRTCSAFVSMGRDDGQSGPTAILPVLMEPSGIRSVIRPELSARDRVRLDSVLSA
jgi:malate dehydrogenase